MKVEYVPKAFQNSTLETIAQAETIINELKADGYQLTLRQLYYQMVSRALIPNRQREYKRLGAIISDARLAGLIDWTAIEDRTRNLQSLAHWTEPSEIISSAASQYRIDLWKRQEYRPEVWIEKDALTGVIGGICRRLDVPYFSCRGYTSQSEMHDAALRLRNHWGKGQKPVILHLGDHDPSGIDMTRDIIDRMSTFMGRTEVERLALNEPQVKQYDPPPNPAKLTDSRAEGYISAYGYSSWELDALSPSVIEGLIEDRLNELIDWDLWEEDKQTIKEQKEMLKQVAEQWDQITEELE
jgi:hypothetical protein